jgi:1-acyl-sn-glycerol-3-phosphate acyltransferase
MPAASLRGFERVSVPLLDAINQKSWMKDTIQLFVRHVSARWVYACTRNLLAVEGLEHVRGLSPARGVLLASNHRSFFDMYVTCAVLYRETTFLRRLFFPVRSPFFYDSPLGLFVNLSISGGAMWPPVFRDDRRALNVIGVSQLSGVLAEPGAVVGIHPEGTRGKGDDPYTLLPPKPGIGQLVLDADADVTVVPFFIAGLSNDILGEIRRNFRPPGQRGPVVRIRFGAPVTAGELARLGAAQPIADAIHARIQALGEEDRRATQAR